MANFTVPLHYIEKPFRTKGLITGKSILNFSVLGTLLFVGIGTTGYTMDGDSPFLNTAVKKRVEYVQSIDIVRQKDILAGICQFNKRGLHKDIDDFIDNWSCLSNDDDTLISTRIGVFGDSHSADKVVAIKSNGIDVMHLGGAACPLRPSAVKKDKPYCRDLLNKFNKVKNIDTVILSHRFRMAELTSKNITLILKYWSEKYKNVILFSPMPEFTGAHKEYERSGTFMNTPDLSFHDKFYSVMEQIERPDNVTIINTKRLFCGDTSICEGIENDELLLTDYGHLSRYGAKRFGKRLIESKEWKHVVSQ